MSAKQIYEFGQFRMDPAERLLLRDGTAIPLTPKAFETLLALVENSGHVVRKDELMKRVWPDAFVEEVNLAQNVSAIRRVLDTETEQYIETVPKLGYRLILKARIRSEAPQPAEAAQESRLAAKAPASGSAPAQAAPAEKTPDLAARQPRFNIGRRIATAALLVLLVGAGVLVWRLRSNSRVAPIRSLVVLPLVNLSGDRGQDYFVDGVTEELTTQIARFAEVAPLRVISRTTAMRYRNTSKSVPQIGRELNVDAVLEGAVIRSGDHVRITAQLIRAANDEHMWAQSYDRNVLDVLSAQADIAQDLATQIRIEIRSAEQASRGNRPQPSVEAQDLYLRARYEWNKRSTENLHRARELFQRAIDLEPNYAAAWAGLADTEYILVANEHGVAPGDGFPRAKDAIERALALDDNLSEAHASFGILEWAYDWNWPEAERHYRRAIELNPNYATAHQYYGLGLASRGRFDEAVAQERRAVDLDPLADILVTNLARVLYYARRYDQAANVCRQGLTTDPNSSGHHRVLGLALQAQGHDQQALPELLKAQDLFPGWVEPMADSVLSYVRLGKRQDARAVINELNRMARNGYVPPSQLARAYAYLGDREKAFEWLDKGIKEERTSQLMELYTPEWDVLRDDPRFVQIQRRVAPR